MAPAGGNFLYEWLNLNPLAGPSGPAYGGWAGVSYDVFSVS